MLKKDKLNWLCKIACYSIVVFAVLEIAFRLLNPLGIGYYNRAYKYLKSCRDTGLGYYLNGKNCNSYGLRSPEIGEKTKKRLLLIGDSIVYGLGASEPFSVKLQRLMPDYEIINAGVGGWNTENESLWLLHEGIYLKPDLVVLFITSNDLENVYAGKKPNYPKWQRVIYNSYALSTIFYIKRNVFKVLFGRTSFKSNVTSDANKRAEKALINIMAVSPKLIACLYGCQAAQHTETMQFYLEILKQNKVPCFYLPENLYKSKYHISTIDHHPNDKGHSLIAKVVYMVLTQYENIIERRQCNE